MNSFKFEYLPHVPSEVFESRSFKEVNILIGANFLNLHPCGGTCRDVAGDLIAYQSDFGLGWVIGCSHPALKISYSRLSVPAVGLARLNIG